MKNEKQSAFTSLTKREQIAAMAMQSMAGNANMSYEAVAFESVKLTDALIAELKKHKLK